MKIRVIDIPVEGRDIEFDLDNQALNERLEEARRSVNSSSYSAPAYIFEKGVHAKLQLSIERLTVFLQGSAKAKFTTVCSRCAENVQKEISLAINYVLKPVSAGQRKKDQVDDLSLGYYDGKEVDCDSIVEELLVLALPYTVLCREDCKGLCPQCGVNLNEVSCACRAQHGSEGLFEILKQIKIS